MLKPRSIKAMMIASAIIIIVGTAFLFYRSLRPLYHLEPYEGDTEGLELMVVGENIEISVYETQIALHNKRNQPSPVYCRVMIEITNTGTEEIDDFEAVRGTMFRENHTPIFSYWIAMSKGAHEPLDFVSISPMATEVVLCSCDLPLYVEHAMDMPRYAYLRIQVQFCENYTAILTTPLTQIL